MGIKAKIKKIINKKQIVPVREIVSYGHELEGKVALITGGSGGIGLAIAKKFIESGCKVIISGTNEEKLNSICDSFESTDMRYSVIDYNEPETFDSKIEECVNLFGRIDILVSSTGIHIDRDGLDFLNSTVEEYDKVMSVNLRGTYFMCQSTAKYMIENSIEGHILIISSQSALEPSWSPYRLSKLGIEGFTKGAAQRLLKHGIVVNAIGPGPTATSMQKEYKGNNIYTSLSPIQRFTMPEEVAEYAKMLVSPLGDTIIGDTIYMSGGRGIIEIR